jgi:hypothetical protein
MLMLMLVGVRQSLEQVVIVSLGLSHIPLPQQLEIVWQTQALPTQVLLLQTPHEPLHVLGLHISVQIPQSAGHEVHVSTESHTPLPHTTAQSLSKYDVHPPGQQLSPLIHDNIPL